MKKHSKILKPMLASFVIATMVFSVAGCKDKNSQTAAGNLEKGVVNYPIDSSETLTFWKELNGNISTLVATENELEFTKTLIERTGINVEFIHPPAGQAIEKFNLMLASGEMADIVQFALSGTREGADELINSGYVAELTPEFLADYAPNFKARLDADTELQKFAKTNEGKYYGFPSWREDDNMTVFEGMVMRDDWLKELGLSEPETIDDWYNVLKAFKAKNGVTAPLVLMGLQPFRRGAFIGAFGTKLDFYQTNGKVVYGPLQDSYKDFLITMNKWYTEGLIDKNFASTDKTELDSKMLSGQSGAAYGLIGSGMGNWLSAGGDGFSIKAVRYPTLEKGGISEHGAKNSRYTEPNVFLFAKSDKKELAARFLDYGYSDEGHLYYNFGVEGKTYNMVDGYPTFSDLVMKNPEGLSATQALSMYTHCTYQGPFEMDERFFKQQYIYDEQKEAIDIWSDTNEKNHMLLGSTSITGDENSEYSKIMNDISKYVDEMTTKMIMGIEPIDKFDDFRDQIKKLGIDRAIEIKQIGYDRHINK